MAFIDCNFFSEVLGISTSMYVILPQETKNQIGMEGKSRKGKVPVLYLLHGLSDDHTIWMRRTSIERYVADKGIAVIMPAANRSFYTDMKHGYKYWTFISEELPEICKSFFPISDKREDTFAAGLSMGGYGAFKLGLRCPDKFAAVASLSGVLDMASHNKDFEEMKEIFGDEGCLKNSENDLFYLAQKLASPGTVKPKLFQCCGTEDFLYNDNIKFMEHAKKLNLDITYDEGHGIHEWGYWDKQIQKVLEWLPIIK